MNDRKYFKKGEVIFKEGDWEMCMYDVVSGKVAIYANYGKHSQKLLTNLDEGRIFGEMALVDSMPRSATAVAEEDTELFVVSGENFDSYFKYDCNKVVLILQSLSQRLRGLSKDYLALAKCIDEYLGFADEKITEKQSVWNKIKRIFSKNRTPDYFFDQNKKDAESLATHTIKTDYKKGEIIFKENAVENWMYDIRWGKVAVYSNFGKPTQKLITTLKSEDFMGEMGMIDGEKRSATAVALEDTKVLVISIQNFNTYLKERPAKVLEILQYLSSRVRALTKQFVDAKKAVDDYEGDMDVNGYPSVKTILKMKEVVSR